MLTIELPPCPNCGRPMHLARTTPRSGLPDLRVFKCGECAVCVTESADERIRGFNSRGEIAMIRTKSEVIRGKSADIGARRDWNRYEGPGRGRSSLGALGVSNGRVT